MKGTLHVYLCTFMVTSCWHIRRIRDISDISCRDNPNTHFLVNNFFFRKSRRLWDNVEKYRTVGQVTDANIIWRKRFPCWTPTTRETHSEYVIIYWFSTATLVTWKRLNVTLYVYWPSRFISERKNFMCFVHWSIVLVISSLYWSLSCNVTYMNGQAFLPNFKWYVLV